MRELRSLSVGSHVFAIEPLQSGLSSSVVQALVVLRYLLRVPPGSRVFAGSHLGYVPYAEGRRTQMHAIRQID